MLAPIQDHMVYVVVVAHPNGPYVPERDVADMDRKAVVADIACGELEDVLQVLEMNPAEHVCSDVTSDILREAAFSILNDTDYDDLNDWQRDFIDRNAAGALLAHRNHCRDEAAYNRSLLPGCAGWGM
ncbi:MAG: hypothetical protein J0G33_02835 [Afipia felis]|nr:hypothetical protein [Afipia felis]